MSKRGSKRPEKASTRPPAKARSSFPQRDPRPPKRGKSGSPPATGGAKSKAGPPIGTSVSGKSTGPATVDKIPSTETRQPKRARKSKGKTEQPEQKFERRTLTTDEQGQMALRAARLSVEARRRERKLKRETKTERDEIKLLRAQAEALEDSAEQGYELVPEGDLFADRRESEAGKSTPTVGQTNAALAEVAKRVGGNGAADEQEPQPKIDPTKADTVRMTAATSGAVDDIERAARADAAEAGA